MKPNIPKYSGPALVILLAILAGTVSCKKSFYTDANVNPNSPSSSSIVPSVLLSTVEGALAYMQGGDLSRFASLNTQQTKGISRQAQGYYQYVYTSQDFDNAWANMYTSTLENNDALIKLSDGKGYNAYSGIGRILRAYALQLAVDTWGGVPYSEAFKGAGNLEPKYDADNALYDTIGLLLTTGIDQLGNADAGLLTPGVEDVIYGGDADLWIKFAHAIRARLYLHQSKGNPTMATNALTEIGLSFSGNADNAQYVFGVTETSANPWYQFNQQRTDISFSEGGTGTKMIALHDPRLPILIDTTAASEHDGLLYYGQINSPVEFITYDELLFASAEATLRTSGDVATAEGYYRDAIKANMEKLGVSGANITAYLAVNGTLPAGVDAAIAQVAEQEYLALYLNPEVWTLWRRTNVPALTPVTGASVPRRLLYPQSEYSYNGANVPGSVTLFSPKVFWDK
ncbi:MAG TPA: SusD/RagB family nutrient-binding outer membrane lipoprotein [Puia sp.]|nr:SusD/RagB family nutrient-binding outer membrane lipoprotein [Puia sp.]